MNWLAIDTSTELASVALLSNQQIFYQEQKAQRTHAQRLLPMIDEVLSKAHLSIKELQAILFGCGPGSFTGLRIACSIAKGLAYAHNLSLIPVSSLATIAWIARKHAALDLPILAVLDARMQEMYWAYYPPEAFEAQERVSPVAKLILNDTQPLVLAGVGIEEYWPEIPKSIKEQIKEKRAVFPNAKAMVELAQAKAIPAIPASEASPIYVRNQVTWDKNHIKNDRLPR